MSRAKWPSANQFRTRGGTTVVHMEILRTPDDRFADLPDFGWEPKYVEIDGMRMAYLDEGSGETVL